MTPIRLRHPKGVSTIQIDIENSTVQDLQWKIRELTDIIPSQQELKAGYPPQPLAIVPELQLSSLGLKQGEQLIVTQKIGSAPAPASNRSEIAPAPVTKPAPETRVPQSKAPISSGAPDYIETPGGALVHRIVPDDNSCLFSSVALVFEQDIGKAAQIRKIVADAIRADPITWSEVILGRTRDEYIATILKPNSWGGAIELAILATHYATEIASIDVETGRIDHFTPSSGATGMRCVLIYSGIHYDAASLAPMPGAPPEFHQTVFPVMNTDDASDATLRAAAALATKLRAKRAYTNTSTFDLRCAVCRKGLKGEKAARAHAMETGHAEFGEY